MVTTNLTESFSEALEGLNLAADVVKSTMGGRGKTVIISDSDAKNLRFTKDGVSVARKISLEDPLKNIGVKTLLSACEKTVEEVGDGTTATAVLLQALLKEAGRNISSRTDINKVFTEIDSDVQEVVKALRSNSQEVTDPEQIRNIAAVSANSDVIGDLFFEVYEQTGLDALIKLERSEDAEETYYDINKGLEFSTGYAHSSFMTDKHTEQAIYEYPYIYIQRTAVNTLTESIQNMLSEAQANSIPVVIIAPRFSDSVIRALSMNKVNSGLQVLPIKAPGFGNAQAKNYDDIEAFLDNDRQVEKIIAGPNYFTIYNSDTPFLESRIAQLNDLKNHALDEYEAQDTISRIYKLKGSSVIIYAGGVTPEALNEEYDRIEDAIGAVNAAVDYGYVAGGGIAMYNLHDTQSSKIVNRAIKEPAYQILVNANLHPESILESLEPNFGYNVKSNEKQNFIESGIIDPTEVVIQSLVNAAAACKLFINSSYILHNHYETKSPFKL